MQLSQHVLYLLFIFVFSVSCNCFDIVALALPSKCQNGELEVDLFNNHGSVDMTLLCLMTCWTAEHLINQGIDICAFSFHCKEMMRIPLT